MGTPNVPEKNTSTQQLGHSIRVVPGQAQAMLSLLRWRAASSDMQVVDATDVGHPDTYVQS